ncbi:MAG: hypothetical protein JRF33_10185 [Deltaproteobacteria bacterium]|nr:hypothetical protein [Deltaproteobacteria bacterium]
MRRMVVALVCLVLGAACARFGFDEFADPDDTTPPSLAITQPNGGQDFDADEDSQTLAGTCSTDAVDLQSSLGVFVDDDCSDGAWSLAPYTLDAGENLFVISASDAAGNQASTSQRIDYDPPPSLEIKEPNGGNDEIWFEPVVILRGTCSTDVVNLQIDLGVLADADCSDGDWSMGPYTMGYPPGPHVFTLTADDGQGNLLADSMTVTYCYVRLDWGHDLVEVNDNPGTITGHCSPEVVSLFLDHGVLVDNDCSDTLFRVELDFPGGEGDYPLEATGTDALARSQMDDTIVRYDITPPDAPVVLASEPVSPNEENFPGFTGEGEIPGLLQLFSDPACTQALSMRLPIWSSFFWVNPLGIVVPDGSSTSVHAHSIDRAGNLSACSTQPFIYEDASSLDFPACDVTLGGALSFVELQAALDQAHADRLQHLGDGVVMVCLDAGALVQSTGPSGGARIRIPGDDMMLGCLSGRATLNNGRDDDLPSSAEAQGGISIVGRERVGLFNLDIMVQGPAGSALEASDSSFRYLRGLSLEANLESGTALLFPSDPQTLRLAEMRFCYLEGHTAMRTRNLRLGLMVDTELHHHGGNGLHLDNSSILIGEIRDCLISSDDPDEGGTAIHINTANRSASIQKMTGTIIRRNPAASNNSGRALWFRHYGSDDTYVSTPNFRDNYFCGSWATLLDPDIGPTLGYDPCNIDETHGAASVPWGDARHAAENPGFNLQSTWGGDCP